MVKVYSTRFMLGGFSTFFPGASEARERSERAKLSGAFSGFRLLTHAFTDVALLSPFFSIASHRIPSILGLLVSWTLAFLLSGLLVAWSLGLFVFALVLVPALMLKIEFGVSIGCLGSLAFF